MGPDLIYGDGGGGCPNCGGMGCDHCGGGLHSAGLLGDVFGCIAPYPDGGCAAVRWYDVAVDYMALRREDAGRRVDFASFGQGAGDIVLSSEDLEYDAEPSFRLSFMWQWAAGSNVEFTYYGLFFWDTVASVSDPTGNLFSPFSEFGLNPAGGFAETDNAEFVAIDYETSFDSFEINFRQRFMAPNCRYQGSCLFGVRYFKLDEDFNYFTSNFTAGDPNADPPTVDTLASLQNNINVHNNMVGPQIGGDLWLCILPGLRLGAEGKAAVLANRIAVDNVISTTSIDPDTR